MLSALLDNSVLYMYKLSKFSGVSVCIGSRVVCLDGCECCVMNELHVFDHSISH